MKRSDTPVTLTKALGAHTDSRNANSAHTYHLAFPAPAAAPHAPLLFKATTYFIPLTS